MDPFFPKQIDFPEWKNSLPISISFTGQEEVAFPWSLIRKKGKYQGSRFLLITTRRGLGWFKDKKNTYHLQEQGSYLLLDINEDFQLFPAENLTWDVLYVLIETPESQNLIEDLIDNWGIMFPFGLSHPVYDQMARIYRSHEVGFGGDRFQVSQSAYTLLMEWYRSAERGDNNPRPWLLTARDLTYKSTEDLTVRHWASRLGTESDFFKKSIQETFGFNPEKYLLNLTLEKLLSTFRKQGYHPNKILSQTSVNKDLLDHFLEKSLSISLKEYSEMDL